MANLHLQNEDPAWVAAQQAGTRISPKGLAEKGWVGSEHLFKHVAGWQLQHCGHPTANYPWQLIAPNGQGVLIPAGRAWPRLAMAAAFVDAFIRAGRCL